MISSLEEGTGFIRLGAVGGSGDCRRRAEGLMVEFWRILVPYEWLTVEWSGTRVVSMMALFCVVATWSIGCWTLKMEYDYNKSIYSTSDDDEDNIRVLFDEKDIRNGGGGND